MVAVPIVHRQTAFVGAAEAPSAVVGRSLLTGRTRCAAHSSRRSSARTVAPAQCPRCLEQLVQLHGRREFAALLVGGADHGSPRFGDDQHLQTMGYADRRVQAFVVKVLGPSPRRETDWQLDDWPEKSARETRWFDPGDAVELVGEGGLAEIIKCFAGSRVRFVAGENPLGSPRACYNLTSRRYLLLPIQTRCMRLIRAALLTDRA
jgi:hypothetical protein